MSENTEMKKVPLKVPFAAEETKPYIFISYAHGDRERVFPIIKEIYEKGWHVWYDQGIEINKNYHNVIADHVLGCEVVVLFVSKTSVTREYVTDTEIAFALDEKKRIIFCELEEAELPSGIRSRTTDRERFPRTTVEGLCGVLEGIEGLTRVPEREAKGICVNAHTEGELALSASDDEYEAEGTADGGVRLTKYRGNDEDVVVPAKWKGRPVVELSRTFSKNKIVKSVTIPDSVTSIGYITFSGCSSLITVTIPNSVESIGAEAFDDCKNLAIECEENSFVHQYVNEYCKSIRIVKVEKKENTVRRNASDKIPFVSDEEEPFVYCSYAHENAAIVYPIMKRLHDDGFSIRYDELDGKNSFVCAKEINSCAYFLAFLSPEYIEGGAVEELRLASPDKRILYWLETCELPKDLRLQQGCIQGLCSWERTPQDIMASIEAVLIEGKCRGHYIPTIPDFDYRADDIGITLKRYTGTDENVVIEPEYFGLPVIGIGMRAFYGCGNLTSVTIPNSVVRIGTAVFDFCYSLIAITVDENNNVYKSIHGVLFSKDEKTLIAYPGGIKGKYSIPDRVTSIGSHAFSGCNGLVAITLPNGVESIESGAFFDCLSLTTVTIPDSVTSISDLAFSDCPNLTVYCPENSYAWQYCEENNIPHKPLEDATAAESDTVSAPLAEVPAAEPEIIADAATAEATPEPAPTPTKSKTHRWLLPLIFFLSLLAGGAAVQLTGLFDILGWLSGLLG